MERSRRRRRRRGRDSSLDVRSRVNFPLTTVFVSFCAILMLCGLSSTMYLVQSHHCTDCPSQSQIKSIANNLQDISVNIEQINNSYQDLERQVMTVVRDLPKLQYDIYYLESLADSVQVNTVQKNKPIPEKPLIKSKEMTTKATCTDNNVCKRPMFYEKKEQPFTKIKEQPYTKIKEQPFTKMKEQPFSKIKEKRVRIKD